MCSYSKKQIAQLLLCSLLLESCYNPNLGTSKKTSQPQQPLPTSSNPMTSPHPLLDPTSQTPRKVLPPPRAAQPLPTPSRAASSTRPASWRKTHALLRSQKPAQAEQKQQIASAQPANEPAPQPIQAIPTTPTHPPSLTHKAPPDIASQVFLAQGGQQVRFIHQDGQWQAQVTERIGVFSRVRWLPVVCERHGDLTAALRALQAKPAQYVQRHLQVLTPRQVPYVSQLVFIGEQGLPGGMDGAGQPSGSSEPQDEPPMTRPVGASERELRPALLSTLEPTQSQGPTPLEQDQQEAAQLREEIAQLYAKLPQATEEADAQVVEELIRCLIRLLELEVLCAPAPGSDGAKEHIEKLRQTHHTHWGSTAYGAKARQQLTALLERAYGQALKREALEIRIKKTSAGVARLVQVLGQLAALHQEQGEETGDLTYYTDAATLYQNMLRVCAKELQQLEPQAAEAPGYQAQIAAAYSGLAQLRQALVAKAKRGEEGAAAPASMSAAQLQAEIEKDQQALQYLRDDAQEKVTQLEALLNKPESQEEERAAEQEYIQGSRALFEEIAQGVKKFLAKLYRESEQELGPAPCQYTVMGLGSMALAQMTPYSDLEFAILMEKAPDAATEEKWRQYLRHLTHLVHLRVINLGETVIPMSKYGMSLDHLGKRGLNFDLGGKTPLGRRDKPHLKKPYELIQPVSGMMDYLKNAGDKMAHMDKLLPFILESTCCVHGDKELHEKYVAEKRAFFAQGQTAQGPPVYKARALKKLLEGVVELDYSQPGITKSGRQQKGDLADFAPQFGLDDAGRLYDVKREIYRLPDRLLYRLAMYYGILPESGWDAVAQLATQGIVGQGASAQDAAHHLQYIVSFAVMLRLRTYLHHGQQAEQVTMLFGDSPEAAQQAVSQLFTLPPAALQPSGSLFKYYYTALPLHRQMEEFFEALNVRPQVPAWLESTPEPDPAQAHQLETLFGKEGKFSPSKEADFFQAEAFYDDRDETRGHIHQRLLQHKASIPCYNRALAIDEQAYGPEHPKVASTLHNLGGAWYQLGDSKQAIEYYKRALAIHEQVYGPEHPRVATSFNNLGGAWYQLGNPKQAISYYERALAIYEQAYGPEHPKVATTLNNLGLAWYQLGDPKQAISYYERALAIYEQALGDEHPHVATSLNNLGSAWDQLGNPKQAISYYERALAIDEQVYGPEHPKVATNLNNLGRAWNELGDPKEAISYCERSLAIYEQAYGSEHPHVARGLNNLGLAWNQLGDPKQAISYYERTLAIDEQVYGPENPRVASTLNNLGLAWNDSGDSKQAVECFERALAIYEQAYEPEHPHVATTLNNLGLAWYQLGDSKQAISYYERALAIYEQAYGPENPKVASTLNNLGSAWYQLGDLKQAISYLERALLIYKNEQVYGPEHPEVATNLNNLGSAWGKLGDPKQAKACFKRALAIYEQAYGPENPKVASTLNNLGKAWYQSGDWKQAKACFKRALAIYEQVYGPDHPDVAMSLGNLGSAWGKLGDPKQVKACFKRALAIYEQVHGPEHPEVATSLYNLGGAWQDLGNPKQAISYYERALAIYEQVYGPDHREVALSLNELGRAWSKLGDSKQAISYHERALAINEQVCGPEHPEVATSLYNLGSARSKLGDSKQAISYYERALAIYEQVYGPDHREVALSLNELGRAWSKLGDSKQAISYHERALAIAQQTYGPESPQVATSLNNLGRDWYQLGDPQQAIGYYERSLAIAQQVYGPEHPEVATSLYNLGFAWGQLEDWKQAMSYFERSLAIIEQAYGPEHPEVATSLNNLGGAWNELGDSQQAISYFERAFDIMKKTYGADHPSTQTIKDNLEQLAGRLENNSEHQAGLFFLICWIAQHEMLATLAQAFNLGWNPNLSNTSQAYPLHYGAMKNPGMVQRLRPYADPFVQTAQGSTPAMVAKSKGNMETLSLLLPSITGLSLQEPAAFDASYATCKAHFLATPTHSFGTSSRSLAWPAISKTGSWLEKWQLGITCTPSSVRSPSHILLLKSLCSPVSTPLLRPAKQGTIPGLSRSLGNLPLKKTSMMPKVISLITWMAQHEMTATLAQAFSLGWNPNLPNTRQVYPRAMKSPSLTRHLLQAGVHPFVHRLKGTRLLRWPEARKR